jgi:hypothetical protein
MTLYPRSIWLLANCFLGTLLLSDRASAAGLIPADRRIDWTPGVNVGVVGGIPASRIQFVNVGTTDKVEYKCYADVRVVPGSAIVAATNILTSLSGGFTANDVGKRIYVSGAGEKGGALSGNITSYTNSHIVVISATAALTVVNQPAMIGTNNKTALQAAIDAAPSNQFVYIPAGTYLVDGTLTPKSNKIIRGAGQGSTVLRMRGNATIQNSGDSPDHTPTITIVDGATKGSTRVGVDSTVGVGVNKLITISALNPPWVHYTPGWYASGPSDDGHDRTRLLNSTHYVTSISGTTINFSPPLPLDMADTPKITPWTIILRGFGVEDLTLDMTDSVALAAVYFSQAYGCWIKNVEVLNATSRQVWFKKMVNSEVRGCFFHGSVGTGSNHEGLDLVQNDCFNLIEDNTLINAGKPAIILGDWGGGCSGNVIGYNYVVNENLSQGALETSICVNHGPHNAMNLVEGNVCQSVKSDGYYGSSSHNTFFRNYISGEYGANVDWPLAVNFAKWSYYSTFVGNVFGKRDLGQIYETTVKGYPNKTKVIWKMGYPNTGNPSFRGWSPDPEVMSNPANEQYADPSPNGAGNSGHNGPFDSNVVKTTIRHGNYDYVNNKIVWETDDSKGIDHSNHSIPPSLYLAGKPSWWPAATPWPPVRPDQDPLVCELPAQKRLKELTEKRPPPPSNLRKGSG